MSDTVNTKNDGDSSGIGYILKQIMPDILGSGLGAGLLTSGLINLAGGDGLEALSYGAMAGGKSSDIYQDYLQKIQREQRQNGVNGQEMSGYDQEPFLQQQQAYAERLQDYYDQSSQNYGRSLQALLTPAQANLPQDTFPYRRSLNMSGYGNYKAK